MALIIATGSNQGDPIENLREAKARLSDLFVFEAASRIYRSQAVDYEAQPDFFNQVIQFALPDTSPDEVVEEMLRLEKSMGRVRDISKGPRIIDMDMIFWGLPSYQSQQLTLPHPRWSERSFVVRPLMELPFFQTIEKCFTIPRSFKVEATPIS